MQRNTVVVLLVLGFGVVSLLADASYEGLRSYLPVGVSESLSLGGLLGVGELLAWGLRPLSGVLAEASGRYWEAVLAGYFMVPLGVALASRGEGFYIAAGYWVERLGKAVRGPARDHLLSAIAPRARRGLVFGVHEALDQVGGILGPLLAYMLLSRRMPLVLLAIPGAAGFLVSLVLSVRYWGLSGASGRPGSLKRAVLSVRLSGRALLFTLIVGLLTPNPLVVEHVAGLEGVEEEILPLIYMVSMLADAIAAVPLGMVYDWSERASIGLVAGLGAPAAILLLSSHGFGARLLAAAALAGVVESSYETIARAMARGAAAYGALGVSRGVAAAGSMILYSSLYNICPL